MATVSAIRQFWKTDFPGVGTGERVFHAVEPWVLWENVPTGSVLDNDEGPAGETPVVGDHVRAVLEEINTTGTIDQWGIDGALQVSGATDGDTLVYRFWFGDDGGALVDAGSATVTLGGGVEVTPTAGTYAAYSGQAIGTSFAKAVTVGAATHAAYTGQSYTISTGNAFTPATGTMQPHSGQATTLTLAKAVTMTKATYAAYAGQSVLLALGKSVEVAAATFAAYAGQAITVVKAKTVQIAAATWQYAGRVYTATYSGAAAGAQKARSIAISLGIRI